MPTEEFMAAYYAAIAKLKAEIKLAEPNLTLELVEQELARLDGVWEALDARGLADGDPEYDAYSVRSSTFEDLRDEFRSVEREKIVAEEIATMASARKRSERAKEKADKKPLPPVATGALRSELERLFPNRLEGLLGRREELLREAEVLRKDKTPRELVDLASSLIDSVVIVGTDTTGLLHQSLYGIADFEETNGEDATLPKGVYEIGDSLVCDTSGRLGARIKGAIYVVTDDYALRSDIKQPLAPTLVDLLKLHR